ncbi:unnamed protein product, partial [marine sediment metagenome]
PAKSAKPNINQKYFQELDKRNIPYILLHATYPDLDSAYVIMDDEKGGFIATQYLLKLGHKDIGSISLSTGIPEPP